MHGIHKHEAGSLSLSLFQVILVRRHLGNSLLVTGTYEGATCFRCAPRPPRKRGNPVEPARTTQQFSRKRQASTRRSVALLL